MGAESAPPSSIKNLLGVNAVYLHSPPPPPPTLLSLSLQTTGVQDSQFFFFPYFCAGRMALFMFQFCNERITFIQWISHFQTCCRVQQRTHLAKIFGLNTTRLLKIHGAIQRPFQLPLTARQQLIHQLKMVTNLKSIKQYVFQINSPSDVYLSYFFC